jgi:hypothetical protein
MGVSFTTAFYYRLRGVFSYHSILRRVQRYFYLRGCLRLLLMGISVSSSGVYTVFLRHDNSFSTYWLLDGPLEAYPGPSVAYPLRSTTHLANDISRNSRPSNFNFFSTYWLLDGPLEAYPLRSTTHLANDISRNSWPSDFNF